MIKRLPGFKKRTGSYKSRDLENSITERRAGRLEEWESSQYNKNKIINDAYSEHGRKGYDARGSSRIANKDEAEKLAYKESGRREQNRGRVKNQDKAHKAALIKNNKRNELKYESDFQKLEAQENLAPKSSLASVLSQTAEKKAYETRKADVMGRRKSRLDDRGLREDIADSYSTRGVDISSQAKQASYREATSDPEWSNMDKFHKKAFLGEKMKESEAYNRTWNSMESTTSFAGVSPNDITFNRQFNELHKANREDIANTLKNSHSQNRSSSGAPSLNNSSGVSEAGRGFDYDNIDTAGVSNGGMYALNREKKNIDFVQSNMNKALTNEDVGAAVKKKMGFETDDELKDFVSNPSRQSEVFADRLESAKSSPTFADNMMGNKVPHMAGGALLTAGLVSSMSNSRGQQSNAQLYGQSQPYY